MSRPTVSSKLSREKTKPLGRPPAKDMVLILGGTFQMGSDEHYPEKAPVYIDGYEPLPVMSDFV